MSTSNFKLKAGDRIELVRMGEDPRPIEPGTQGTVKAVSDFGRWQQVQVDWDNGRGLMLCLPQDKVRIL